MGSRQPDRPAEWLIKWLTLMSAFPLAANSGQYFQMRLELVPHAFEFIVHESLHLGLRHAHFLPGLLS